MSAWSVGVRIAFRLAAEQAVGHNAQAWQLVDRSTNKAHVLDPVRTALSREGIVPMQADWTRPDGSISRNLGSFGCFGIPINTPPDPGAPEDFAPSKILTSASVLKALKRAPPR
ncbi:hypothetical protein [Maliponia aquimaris]|uniref:Uncharacterized protein n=1 Tax=Maliponia aquimaris TaxID=1673631 RepID=A0A238L3V5_9RHOB|nr:hypothetical protein [Maliponia aquimaris]SMX49763.1 hypothetical protein MAA8898_04430 [Maliponia aquimaris]